MNKIRSQNTGPAPIWRIWGRMTAVLVPIFVVSLPAFASQSETADSVSQIVLTFQNRVIESARPESGSRFRDAISALQADIARLSFPNEQRQVIVAVGEILHKVDYPFARDLTGQILKELPRAPTDVCREASAECWQTFPQLVALGVLADPESINQITLNTRALVRRWSRAAGRSRAQLWLESIDLLIAIHRRVRLESGEFPSWIDGNARARRLLETQADFLVSQLRSTKDSLEPDSQQLVAIILAYKLYFDRLGQISPQLWLNAKIDDLNRCSGQDFQSCSDLASAFLTALDVFKTVELRLPTRHLWMETMNRVFQPDSPARVDGLVIFEAVEEVLERQATQLDLRELYENEVQIFQLRSASQQSRSLYGLFQRLLFGRSILADLAPRVTAEPTNEDLTAVYREAVTQMVSVEFLRDCWKRDLVGPHGDRQQRFVENPLVPGLRFDVRQCAGTDPETYVSESVTHHFRDYSSMAWRGLGYAAAFAAGFAASHVTLALVLRTGHLARWARTANALPAASMTRHLRLWSLFTTEAVIDVTVFTITYKVVASVLELEPLWRSDRGVLGNVLLPVTLGTLSRLAMPSLYALWVTRKQQTPLIERLYANIVHTLQRTSFAYVESVGIAASAAVIARRTSTTGASRATRDRVLPWLMRELMRTLNQVNARTTQSLAAMAPRLGPRLAGRMGSASTEIRPQNPSGN